MNHKIQIISIGVLILGGLLTAYMAIQAPTQFPVGLRFDVHEGESLQSISMRLEDEHIITSAVFFRGWISLLGKDKEISLGTYEFHTRLPMGLVIAKFARGPDDPLLSVTIPEGKTVSEVAKAFKKAIPSLREDLFVQRVQEKKLDGYLFPSTYYPLPSFTEEDIIKKMKETFDKNYSSLFQNKTFPEYVPTQHEVITLASIIEGEANTEEDMKIVSGILQKRLSQGMRLQVDVARITYEKTGLPEKPINNPGNVAISAVFNPIHTPYLYYLTGNDGRMYYARNFEDHKRNIQKYLR